MSDPAPIRWNRWVAAGLGGLFLLLAVLFAVQRGLGEYRLHTVRRRLSAQGELLSVAQLTPKPAAASENACDPLVALESRLREGSWVVAHHPRSFITPKGDGISFADLDGWDTSRGGEDRVTWPEFRRRVAGVAGDMEGLEEILRRPRLLGSQTRYDTRFPVTPHLVPLRSLALCLASIAAVQAREGSPVQGVRPVEAGLRICTLLREEPLLVSQQVRLAIQDSMVLATWHLLATDRMPDEELARLATAWGDLAPGPGVATAVAMERAGLGFEADRCQRSLEAAEAYVSDDRAPTGGGGMDLLDLFHQIQLKPGRRVRGWVWQKVWAPGDVAAGLEVLQRAVDVQRGLVAGRSWADVGEDREAVARWMAEIGGSRARETPLSHTYVGRLSGLDSLAWSAEARRRLVLAAIALQQYRRSQGALPARLDDLVPRWLSAVPRDPYDGGPLRYRPQADGRFVLYAVGEDLRDDGGRVEDRSRAEMLETIWAALGRSEDRVWPAVASHAAAVATLGEFEKRTRAP